MKGLHLGHCVIGAVIAIAVLLALGLPTDALYVVLVLAACPLMMVLMLRTMGGTRHRDDEWSG